MPGYDNMPPGPTEGEPGMPGWVAALPELPDDAEVDPVGGLPPGATPLTVGEAIECIVTGDHPEVAAGSLGQDLVMVDMLRRGLAVGCKLPDGKLAFAPTGLLLEHEEDYR